MYEISGFSFCMPALPSLVFCTMRSPEHRRSFFINLQLVLVLAGMIYLFWHTFAGG